MSPCKTVGAVIVNYNAGDFLVECVASAKADGIDRIVVVDNGSNDGSDAKLVAEHPDVDVLRLDNPGLGVATNVGAQTLDTDVVFCLNPDTRLHVGATKALLDALNANGRLAIVAPKLLNTDGSLYPSARSFPNISHSIGHAVISLFKPNNKWTRQYKRLDADYDASHEVDWVSGAAMFVRRTAFDEVHGFDPSYFLYMEDVDLCWRLRNAGWTIAYEPSAVVTHAQGVSTARSPYRTLKAHHLSAIRYNLRTTSGASRLLLPLVIMGLLVRLPAAWAHKYLALRR